jgi:hypothetical protein
VEQGVLSLKPLYDFVEGCWDVFEDRNGISAPSAYFVKSGELGRAYCEKCEKIVSKSPNAVVVPPNPGFYLWGFYNVNKFWVNVYLGMASEGKAANLGSRLYEELTNERAFVWRNHYSREQVIGFDPNYPVEAARALRKAGSTHVFWVATPHLPKESIKLVEKDLIEAMNPTGNRARSKPLPTLQNEAGEIFDSFRGMIHRQENRNTQFHVDYHDEFWRWVGESEPSTP